MINQMKKFTGAFTLLTTLLTSLAMGQSPAQCELTGLHPDDRPTTPQETTASLGANQNPSIYQWGIIHLPPQRGAGPTLPMPEFVHQTHHNQHQASKPQAILDYSALYIHPPMRLTETLNFDVQMQLPGGIVTHWYPYATQSSDTIKWNSVLAGVQADGLITTQPQWMTARAVTTPATLKVYKPGSANTKPDDPGTTEGEVFLFARGNLDSSALPVTLRSNPDGNSFHLQINRPTSATLHAWVIQPETGTDHQCADAAFRVDTLHSEGEQSLQLHPPANDLQSTFCAENLRTRWNEAFVGSGLPSDEANALAQLLQSTITATNRRIAVILLPPDWTNEIMPLNISGSPAEPPARVFVAVAAF